MALWFLKGLWSAEVPVLLWMMVSVQRKQVLSTLPDFQRFALLLCPLQLEQWTMALLFRVVRCRRP